MSFINLLALHLWANVAGYMEFVFIFQRSITLMHKDLPVLDPALDPFMVSRLRLEYTRLVQEVLSMGHLDGISDTQRVNFGKRRAEVLLYAASKVV